MMVDEKIKIFHINPDLEVFFTRFSKIMFMSFSLFPFYGRKEGKPGHISSSSKGLNPTMMGFFWPKLYIFSGEGHRM